MYPYLVNYNSRFKPLRLNQLRSSFFLFFLYICSCLYIILSQMKFWNQNSSLNRQLKGSKHANCHNIIESMLIDFSFLAFLSHSLPFSICFSYYTSSWFREIGLKRSTTQVMITQNRPKPCEVFRKIGVVANYIARHCIVASQFNVWKWQKYSY